MSTVRAPRVVDIPTAVDVVRDGMTIGIGGFINSGHPMALLRELIRRGAKDLRVVGAASAGLEVDMLIAAGCVSRVVAPYVGAEGLAGIGPAMRCAVEAGQVVVEDFDEAHYYAGLRAAAQRLPFHPWRAGVGTSFPQLNPAMKEFDDPLNGERLIAVPALEIDVALIHAAVSDHYGNVQHNGTRYGDVAICDAADHTVAQVERFISNEEIRARPRETSIAGADVVVRAPFGSHPFSSDGYYALDEWQIKEYVGAAEHWRRTGDRAELDRHLATYVYEPEDHFAYLERVGVRRFLSLSEY